jgi:tRNA A37 threonylcarbamoyltransferase TsaD
LAIFKKFPNLGGLHYNLKFFRKSGEAVGVTVYFPKIEFCTDNGAMIAFTGYQYLKKGLKDLDLAIEVKPRWNITELKY